MEEQDYAVWVAMMKKVSIAICSVVLYKSFNVFLVLSVTYGQTWNAPVKEAPANRWVSWKLRP